MSEGQQTTAIALRSVNRINDTTFERIWKYYYDTKTQIELKPKEEEIRIRLDNIWGYLGGEILTDRKAIQAHVKWCEEKGFKISERTAYEDLQHAKMLWGDRAKQTKAAQRAVMNEILTKAIKECTDKKKHMSLARLVKEYVVMNDLKNHNNDESKDRPAIVINFGADPQILMKQREELRKRAALSNAEDTEYEQVA